MQPDLVKLWVEELEEEAFDWEMKAADDLECLDDAFSRNLSFGTGGIRGLMGIGPNRMNRLTIGKAAQGLANYLLKNEVSKDIIVAIGYDTRLHSRGFAETTASVLSGNGIRVYLFADCQPTPVLGYAVRKLGCAAGVVITASHNPMQYNGFKVYDSTGDQITDSMARGIQREIERVDAFKEVTNAPFAVACEKGLVNTISDSLFADYLDAVVSESLGVDASSLRIVYSPLNGTGLGPACALFDRLNITYSLVEPQASPNGMFPSCPSPNPENHTAMELGMEQLEKGKGDLFLANDPDADRVGAAVLHNGKARLLTGDEVSLLIFDYIARNIVAMKDTSQRDNGDEPPIAVTTIVSTPLLDVIAQKNGVELRRTLTGFKYIGEQIGLLEHAGKTDRFILGMEESCGYLRGSYVRDKDGICGLMLICEIAAAYKNAGKDLVEALDMLYKQYGYIKNAQRTLELPGVNGHVATTKVMRELRKSASNSLFCMDVARTNDFLFGNEMPVVGGASSQHLPPSDVIEIQLSNGCKVIVRPSGTEPKIKAYVFASGQTDAEAQRRLESLCEDLDDFFDRQKRNLREETEPVTHIVLLSGGSGTRLWPLSNSARSKQFLKVLRDEQGRHVSMVQRVFSQIGKVPGEVDVTIATSASQAESLDMQVPGRYALVTEPERRDTAPAIMLACAHLRFEQGASDGDPVIVMPIDTFADQSYYDQVTKVATEVTKGISDLVLLGVKPTHPSEKYGYIIPVEGTGDIRTVEAFREKPNKSDAEEYIAHGGLWNCGVFGFSLGYMCELTSKYYDPIDYEDMLEHYSSLPKNSFDYEVVEKAACISVIPYSGTWKDLGTWNTLSEEMVEHKAGRVFMDEASTSGVHAINETGLPIVVAGITDAVVVATPDGILVSSKEQSSRIKDLVSSAALVRPMYEDKAWGHYRMIESDEVDSPITEIALNKGESATFLAEERPVVYTVMTGQGIASYLKKSQQLSAGSTFTVKPDDTVEVIAKTPMKIIGVEVIA